MGWDRISESVAAHASRVFELVGRTAYRFRARTMASVSERGTSLSGGQKQCVAIARAILRDSPIVVLDEPTSSMDSETEKLVMNGIRQLTAGRTVLVMAHRLATVRDADMVIVLRDGAIVEQGSPSALLERGAVFAGLASAQALTLRDYPAERASEAEEQDGALTAEGGERDHAGSDGSPTRRATRSNNSSGSKGLVT